MSNTDFVTLRNLAFFNTPPEPDYFYYESLGSFRYKSDKYSEYNEKADQIAATATSILNTTPSFAEDDDTLVKAQIDELIQFLEQSIEYERKNEIAFFKNKIRLLKNTEGLKDEAVVQELSQYLSLDNFQYDKITTLINVLLQGVENTEAIVKHEIEHITQVDNAMKQLKTARMSQLLGLWESSKSAGIRQKYEGDVTAYLQAAKNRLDNNIMVEYTTHGNLYSNIGTAKRKFLPGTKKWLSSLKTTVDVTVGHWITESIHKILESPSDYAKFVTALQRYYDFNSDDSQDKAEAKIKEYLIKTATVYATKNIASILNNAYAALDTGELADMIASSIESLGELSIEGLYDNFGMYGRTVKLFKDAASEADMEANEAKGLYDAYLGFRNELKQLKKSKEKMTLEQQFLKKAMKTGTDEDKYTSIYVLISRLESLQKRMEQHAKDPKQRYENWLSKETISVSGKERGELVTIQIPLKNGEIDIPKLLTQLQSTRALKNLGGRKSRAQSLEGIIRGLKARTSFSIKQDLIEAITPLTTAATKKGLGGEEFVINAIKDAIENKKISVGGPTFSEIKQGIQESLRSGNTLNDWVGKLNKKNDFVVVVTVDDEPPNLSKALDQMIDHDSDIIAEGVAERLKKAADSYVSGFALEFQNRMQKNKADEESFNSYKANADAFFEAAKKRDELYNDLNNISTEIGEAWQLYSEQMKTAGANAEEINKKREKVLRTFEDSFYQSSTMKTYNQYQSNIGFIGGSLGADIMSQLDNLNEIFTAANMPISDSDMEWLLTAVINCSPLSIIGERHKNIIEDYLGSLAAFALFDEGGAEAEIISGIAEKTRKGYSSPNILHIYATDSIYVPGSYVLTKVVEELKACASNAYKAYQSQRRGATIAIVNPMNEGMIPNRGKFIDVDNPPNTDPWGTVASIANRAVKLKILFLAGLLDIAHDIERTLSGIQLPQ